MSADEKPWLRAGEDTWWLVSGYYPAGGTFSGCVAHVVPRWLTQDPDGEHPPTFEVLVWGDTQMVSADHIRAARPLRLVFADSEGSA